jgi:hypothetical protein
MLTSLRAAAENQSLRRPMRFIPFNFITIAGV